MEYALILDTNKRLLEAGDDQARSEEEILIELNKKNLSCGVSMTRNLYARERDIENQLELVKKAVKMNLICYFSKMKYVDN